MHVMTWVVIVIGAIMVASISDIILGHRKFMRAKQLYRAPRARAVNS